MTAGGGGRGGPHSRKFSGARDRYIAIAVRSGREVTKGEVIAALRRQAGVPFWLVNWSGARGILRCTNLDKERLVRNLQEIRLPGAVLCTVRTSGTIRKAMGSATSAGAATPRPPP